MTIPENDKLAIALDKLIPKRLDEVITRNRNHAELRLATADDLAPLRADIPYVENLAQNVRDWSLITLDWHPPRIPRQCVTRLLGFNMARAQEWHTSSVEKFDPGTGCIITYSGNRYRVVGPCSDQPDLLRVCAVVHGMGVGNYLGIMHVFY